jgi:hypothetical protein
VTPPPLPASTPPSLGEILGHAELSRFVSADLWISLKSMGLFGLLVLLALLGVIVTFWIGLTEKKPSLLPAVLGGVGLILGVLGTFLGLLAVQGYAARMPLAPADLAEGATRALITTAMGVFTLLCGAAGSALLAVICRVRGAERPKPT